MISDKVFNTNGSQKIFGSDFPIISEDHVRVFLSPGEYTDTALNAVVTEMTRHVADLGAEDQRLKGI